MPLLPDLAAADSPSELRIGYSVLNPLDVVLKQNGWLEKEFDADHLAVRWVPTSGSHMVLERMKYGNLDIGSSTVVAAALSRAGGNRVRLIFMYAGSESAMILVNRDASLQSLHELKGKK